MRKYSIKLYNYVQCFTYVLDHMSAYSGVSSYSAIMHYLTTKVFC